MMTTATRTARQIAPHTEEAERGALGAALQDRQAAATLNESLRPSDCFHSKNAEIHAAIETVLSCGGHADLVTVPNILQERGQLQEIGGGYLAALVDETPAPSHHLDYIGIVKRKALARRTPVQGETLPAGLVLVPLGKGCALLLTATEFARGLWRGKWWRRREALRRRGEAG
jgi:replicative DNA helicase